MSPPIEQPGTGTATASTEESPPQLDREIATLRDELSSLVGEADRRRHELLDIRGQVKRHVVPIAVGATAAVGAGAGLVWLAVERARRRQRLPERAGRLREAVSRMMENPERVAADQSVPTRIFAAAASALAAAIVSKSAARALDAILERRPTTTGRRSHAPE